MLQPRKFFCLILLASLCGCGASAYSPATAAAPEPSAANQAYFNQPPKQIVQAIERTLQSESIGVQSDDHGVILAAPKEFPGTFHIARRWQEQTQFRILVIPDWDNPTAKCSVLITEQTMQRATDNQPWQPAPELSRPQRAVDLLTKIKLAAGQS